MAKRDGSPVFALPDNLRIVMFTSKTPLCSDIPFVLPSTLHTGPWPLFKNPRVMAIFPILKILGWKLKRPTNLEQLKTN